MTRTNHGTEIPAPEAPTPESEANRKAQLAAFDDIRSRAAAPTDPAALLPEIVTAREAYRDAVLLWAAKGNVTSAPMIAAGKALDAAILRSLVTAERCADDLQGEADELAEWQRRVCELLTPEGDRGALSSDLAEARIGELLRIERTAPAKIVAAARRVEANEP